MPAKTGKSNGSFFRYFVLLVLIALAILVAGYIYLTVYEFNFRIEVERQLSIVADLKIAELQQFRMERQGDAQTFYGNEAFIDLVRRYFSDLSDADSRGLLLAWFDRTMEAYKQYDRIRLLDEHLIERLSSPEIEEPLSESTQQSAREALESGRTVFLDFYRSEFGDKIHLALLVPILDNHEGDRPIGVLMLRIDPERYLYPFVKRWPGTSTTAETLLVRRDGADALFLNELRFQKNTALNLRIPLSRIEVPAVQAILGREGIVEGTDYRGMQSIAFVRAVPDSPWSMVVRIDQEEAFAPLYERRRLMILLVSLLLLSAVTLVGLAWGRQHIRFANERLDADSALRESEERFRRLFEDAVLGLYRTTPSGVILMANPALCRMLGYESLDALLARNLEASDFHPEHPRTEFKEELERKGSVSGMESSWRRSDGSYVFIRESARLHRDQAGNILYYEGTVEDITVQKQIEEERARLASVLDTATNFVSIIDGEGRGIYVNASARRMLGLDADQEMDKQSVYDFMTDQAQAIVQEQVLPHIRVNGYWSGEFDMKTPAGEIPMAATVTRHQQGHGGEEFFSIIASDISERKKLEEQLRQAQKMESIGRLAGGVAHDFNNLLTVINNFAELSIEQLRNEDPLRKYQEYILDAGNRAANLTRQLLAFSRRQVLKPALLDLNDVVAGMEKMLRRMIGEDIQLVNAPGADLGKVRADQGQIEQILLNLAINSRDAMPEGGKLTIETANVELDREYAKLHAEVTPGPYVLLAVSDTGCGMDEQTRAQVFEPFFSTKTRDKGTGLGLSTVYGIVKQSGGSIWVYSEPGQGATFKIYLPRVFSEQELEDRRERQPSVASLTGSETILVVEDAGDVRNVIEKTLAAAGYNVLSADLPDAALRICAEFAGRIELLLSDVIMPQLNGRELSRRIVELRPEIKVLFMSGYTDNAIVHHGVLDPGINFIAKPFANVDLLKAVRSVLDKPVGPAGVPSA